MRNGYYDFLKGIAILFVIAIHAFPIASMQQPLHFSFGNLDCYNLLLRQFIVLAVPLFCTISGFFVGKKSEVECMQFSKSHSLPLYIPALLWSLPYIAYDFYKGLGTPETNILYFFTLGYSRHYFISIMLQFYLLLPFLVKTSSKKQVGISIVVSLISIGTFSYYMYIKGMDIPLIVYEGLLPVWIMYFSIGIYLSRHNRDYNLKPYIILSVIFLIVSCLETRHYIDEYGQMGGVGYKISNFVFSLFIVLVLMSRKIEAFVNGFDNPILEGLKWCGKNSLAIFFIHSPIQMFVLTHLNISGWIFPFCMSFLFTFVLIVTLKRVLKGKILLYIGIR